MSLFTDEFRSPIYIDDLCKSLLEIGADGAAEHRIMHVAGPEGMSRHYLATQLAKFYGYGHAKIPQGRLLESHITRPADITLNIDLAESLLETRLRTVDEVTKAAVPKGP